MLQADKETKDGVEMTERSAECERTGCCMIDGREREGAVLADLVQ